MEPDGKGTLEEKQHDRASDPSSVGNGCLELDLVDERGLGGHHEGHDGDHGEKQWPSADAVDEKPGDETRDEEPELEEAGHESREVVAEADVLEERRGIIYDGVDAA